MNQSRADLDRAKAKTPRFKPGQPVVFKYNRSLRFRVVTEFFDTDIPLVRVRDADGHEFQISTDALEPVPPGEDHDK